MRSRKPTIVVSVLFILLGGCGTKGPLFVPGVPVGAQWPYPAKAPAPQTPERKPADVPATSDEKK